MNNSAAAFVSALPGGYRSYDDGYFHFLGNSALFWSATELDTHTAWSRGLAYGGSAVYRDNDNKRYGFSVRLVRD